MKDHIAFPSSPHNPTPLPVAVPAENLAPSNAQVKRWPLFLGLGVAALGVCALGAASGAYSSWSKGDSIAAGVSIAGVPVGGLSKSEAQKELESRFGRLFVSIETDARPFQVSLRELGGAPAIAATIQKAHRIGRDEGAIANFLRVYGSKTAGERLMLPVIWEKKALVAKLSTINSLYRVPAADARLEIGENGARVIPGTEGKSLNIGETALQIQRKYFVGAPKIAAATREVAPKIDAADLAGKDVELAKYTTRFNPGERGRTTNIHVAVDTIDGLVLMPGDLFSFNKQTGQRTWKKGYRMAHIFETKPGETEAEVVDGLAGGVCQVSSTLFNAVRRANERVGTKRLKIVERNSHSLPVTYVPRGLDATVAWPYKDFRFRNTFDHPVFLRATVAGSRLTLRVMGRVPSENSSQSVESESDLESNSSTE
ncbi:MAG TPA: VanW family protein [Abditibacterium sp.]